ncbi:hypothetical protein HDU67_006131, partial [Dinochytrium kinnereticum]
MADNARTAIQVAARCRPVNGKEISNLWEHRNVTEADTIDSTRLLIHKCVNGHVSDPPKIISDSVLVRCNASTNTVVIPSANKSFAYDKVFGPDDGQEKVFQSSVEPLIRSCLDGFIGTVFAYGPTGSGKTHTIFGDLALAESEGILPRAVRMIFGEIGAGCAISMSYIEIYNEELVDLLTDPAQPAPKLRIRGDLKAVEGIFVENAKEVDYFDPADLIAGIALCASKRKSAETLLNPRSSRSHTICQLTVKEFTADGYHKRGRFKLVDLAGSECVGKSGVANQGQKEAGQINQSLLTLGRVINAVKKKDEGGHVPYRDSKLTLLLQDSIGGNARTLMIATFSPMVGLSAAETAGTLAYAFSVRSVCNELVSRGGFVKCDPVSIIESVEKQKSTAEENRLSFEALSNAMLEQSRGLHEAVDKIRALMEDARRMAGEEIEKAVGGIVDKLNASIETRIQSITSDHHSILSFERDKLGDEIRARILGVFDGFTSSIHLPRKAPQTTIDPTTWMTSFTPFHARDMFVKVDEVVETTFRRAREEVEEVLGGVCGRGGGVGHGWKEGDEEVETESERSGGRGGSTLLMEVDVGRRTPTSVRKVGRTLGTPTRRRPAPTFSTPTSSRHPSRPVPASPLLTSTRPVKDHGIAKKPLSRADQVFDTLRGMVYDELEGGAGDTPRPAGRSGGRAVMRGLERLGRV